MAIHGDLSTVNLPDILQLLNSSGNSGTLTLIGENTQGSIFFRHGDILFANSSNPEDQFIRFLVKQGELSEEQAQAVLDRVSLSGETIEKALVQGGFIIAQDIIRLIQKLSYEIIYDFFQWTEGKFQFIENNLPALDFGKFDQGLNIYNVIMEGVRRIDEWNRISDIIQNKNIVFELTDDQNVIDAEIKSEELHLLSLVNGQRSIAEICEKSSTSEFDTFHHLFILASAGIIIKTGEKEDASITERKFDVPVKKTKSKKLIALFSFFFISILASGILWFFNLLPSPFLQSINKSKMTSAQTETTQHTPNKILTDMKKTIRNDTDNQISISKNKKKDNNSSLKKALKATPAYVKKSHSNSNSYKNSYLININSAGKSLLCTLPRIGPKTADHIIAYRNRHTFKKISDIMKVKGIGTHTFANLKDKISVSKQRKNIHYKTASSTPNNTYSKTTSSSLNKTDSALIDTRININTADASELESLPRIGPKIAQRIIDYRKENDNFKTIEELKNVKGIGPKTFKHLREFITIGSD